MHVSSGDKKSHPSLGKSRNHYLATPYDTEHETRLYVDSSPAGLQTRLVQAYDLDGEEH